MRKNRKLLIIAALLFITALWMTYRHFFGAATTMPQDIKVVEVAKVSLGNLVKTVRLIGSIRAENSATLIAQDVGILEIIVSSGKKVAKDELIAKIISPEAEKRYLLSIAAENIAKDQMTRASNLLKSDTYSKSEFEKYKNTWIIASKDASDSKIALDKLQFKAPFAGIVGAYKMQSGAQLKINDIIVSFYDPNKIRVEFDVPMSLVPYVNDGQDLSVLGKDYKLTHIQKMLDENKHMSPAYCEISCNDCIIGSNIDVDLTVKRKDQVIVIPFEAVFLRDGKMSVYVIIDNKAVIRNVTTGMQVKNNIEILSGLELGEEFVSFNPTRLYPGVAIKIKQ